MLPKVIIKIVENFSKFPTIGEKTALRFALYLAKLPKEEFEKFIQNLKALKEEVFLCQFCFFPFAEKGEKLCKICKDTNREREIICVVEKEQDLIAIEESKAFKGIYFILGGIVKRLKKEELEKLRIKELKERIISPQKFGINSKIKEIILALNPTTEGEATALYLKDYLKDLNLKITKIAKGLPSGGELEYADQDSIISALKHRE